ncbi:MAG TPA: acetylornithine/succinylornithine family transaminase [Vicinamibacteria bacterium]|nr:acetylornithine/succinylornithine family transaminase [Vicinamibacteria bacterium]
MTSLLPVYERDLVLVSGRGARVTDSRGNTYLDFAAGIGVNGLGYGNQKVVAAIRKQAGKLIHSSNLYFSEPVLTLADRLVGAAFPARVFFTNSGTESVEAAIKFARRIGHASGRTELVAFEGAFHGRTLGALSITYKEKYRAPFEPLLPGVRFCAWNDLGAARAVIGPKTAAVFIEPVQGEGGIRVAPDDFLQGLADICRDAGTLLVSDEVQCGLGRTGAMFAYQRAHIRPDILTLAKPLGGGLPLGAVLLREELAGALSVGDHGSTFGGNPVAAAASLAVLDRITSGEFLAKVDKKGQGMRRALRSLQRKYPEQIADVRGLGLMFGVELKGAAGPVVSGLRERGILATKAGDNVLRLLPPLMIKRAELQAFLVSLDSVLATGAGRAVEAGGGGAVA